MSPRSARARLRPEGARGEERHVDGGRRSSARAVDDGVKVIPPGARCIHEAVAGVPYRRMLAGADLVVHPQHVQVPLGPQVESAHISRRDKLHETLASMVGGDEEPARPVPLAGGADQTATGIAGPKTP